MAREKQHKRRSNGTNGQQKAALAEFVVANGFSPVSIDFDELVDPALPFPVNKNRVTELLDDLVKERDQMMQELSNIFLHLFVPTMFLYSSLVLYFSYLFDCIGL